jgi:hypothetical protein
MAEASVNLLSSDPTGDGDIIVNRLISHRSLAGKRGESAALAASNLIGAWNKCIAALAGKGAEDGAGARATVIDLLDQNAVSEFSIGAGDEATATACAKSASGILSQIFADAALARLLANYARGNDASATDESAAAVAAFSEAYAGLTEALNQKEFTAPVPTAAPATPP